MGFFQESVLVPELVDIFFNDLADGKVRVLIIFANDTWLGGNAGRGLKVKILMII